MLTLNLSVHGVFDLFHQSASGELGSRQMLRTRLVILRAVVANRLIQ